MNTADYLLETADDNRVALIENKRQYTYHDLREASARVAGELLRCGVQPGDRIGLLGNNSLFWVATYLAAFKLGAVAVPFATVHPPETIAAQQAFMACKVMCAERRLQRRFVSAFDPTKVAFITEAVLEEAGPREWPATPNWDVQQDAAFMFTSGTTAKPRAVRVTHRNIQANTSSIIEYLDLGADDRMLAILQFYYCFGASLLHTHLRVGGSLVLANSFVYPEVVLDLMEATACTGFAGVPSTYQTLLRNSTFPKRQIQSLRKVQQAGGKLQTVLIQELVQAVPRGQVYVMYGQTEATARLSYLPPELLNTKLGSIGRGIPGVTLRVMNESGTEVNPGEVGEIYAWGDNISPGYLDDPEASAQKFIAGVLHTGDLATIDEDGFIYVVDRKADFIKSYGYRVSSQEVEGCIVEVADVVAAAVIGEPDLVRGEAIKAFVVLRNGSQVKAEEIISHCAARLASYMVPKDVVFIDQLPINAHGKIVKTELRKLATPA
ncbi:MAG TPA: AMP-binding protein [Anaerolineae bacterium]|nr:AMP-binding protein [Anaerolineae bacterium]